MANELTTHYNLPKPNPAHDIKDDVIPLQLALDMVDAALHVQAVLIAGKAADVHGHTIGGIDGLTDALTGKMAATRTFALAELTDVIGAGDAINNYVLVKIDGEYVFRSALSVLDEHFHTIAQVSGLTAALALLAPKADAVLTGNPVAPTQAAGNNTTRLATTAFVQAAITALIGAAPGVLDTLDELAAALGDDANFAATMTASLAAKMAGTNGTATNPTISGGKDGVAALVTGTAITLDPTVSHFWRIATTGNPTVTLPAPVAGVTMSLTIEYGGAHTPAYAGGTRKWVDGEIMEPTSVAGKKDRLLFVCDDGLSWDIHIAGQNI